MDNIITKEILEQEIFETYTLFPDKDKSCEFNRGMIYAMGKYGIIKETQIDNAHKYNEETYLNFE